MELVGRRSESDVGKVTMQVNQPTGCEVNSQGVQNRVGERN